MIDGRTKWGGDQSKDAAAWSAVRELRRALVLQRDRGEWKRPLAEAMTLAEGLELFHTASGVGHRAIPALLDYALHPILGQSSLAMTLLLLAETDAMQRLWLDRRVRRSSGWGGRPAGDRAWWGSASRGELGPEYVMRTAGELTRPAWWLFTMAPDGHLRERALGELKGDSDVMSLAHLLIRTMDWVREVRLRASSAWSVSLPLFSPEQLIPLTPLVAHMAQGTWQERAAYDTPFFARLDPRLVERFSDAFAGQSGEDALLAAVRGSRTSVARASFNLILSRGTSAAKVLEVGHRSGDVTIQRRAFDHGTRVGPPLLDQAVALGLRSRFAGIRIQALGHAAERSHDPGALATLEEALFDRSESVRACARFLLRAAGHDPTPAYREALRPAGDPRRLVAAILALADLERDWIVAADHLADPRPNVRAAAVAAIGRSDREVAREVLPPLLADPSPAVSSAARTGLEPAGPLTLEQLTPLLVDSRVHVWRNASRLLHRCGAWPWLLGALRLAQAADPERSRVGDAHLRRWSARPYLPHQAPPPELRSTLVLAAVGARQLPRRVLEAFASFDLELPTFHDLLAGSNEDLEVTARDVAEACQIRLVRRHAERHGGWYFTSWPEPDKESVQERILVQPNRNDDQLAEPTYPDWRTLVYVLTTAVRERREADLGATGMTVLRVTRSTSWPRANTTT